MHHYPFHLGDYLLETAHLPPMADLAYRRLLDLYYKEEAPIPNKPKWVANRIRLDSEEAVIGFVLREYFELRGTGIAGFWHNSRADKVIAKYQKKAAVARENGVLHVAGTKIEPKSDADRFITKTRTRTINTPLPPEGVARFDEFWSAYPKKKNKPAALRAFTKAMGFGSAKAAATLQELMAGLAVHVTCRQWTKDGGEFIPDAASWLNAEGWNDKPLQPDQDEGASGWWCTAQGLRDKGMELGIPAAPDSNPQSFMRFKASVWVKAGDGPWWDDKDTAYALAVRLRNADPAEQREAAHA